jgi:hypothetical protein
MKTDSFVVIFGPFPPNGPTEDLIKANIFNRVALKYKNRPFELIFNVNVHST